MLFLFSIRTSYLNSCSGNWNSIINFKNIHTCGFSVQFITVLAFVSDIYLFSSTTLAIDSNPEKNFKL